MIFFEDGTLKVERGSSVTSSSRPGREVPLTGGTELRRGFKGYKNGAGGVGGNVAEGVLRKVFEITILGGNFFVQLVFSFLFVYIFFYI